jgi:hypothetical protein
VRRLVGILLALLMAVSGPMYADNKDDVPLPEPTNGCDYCGLARCGCASAPLGFYLSYSCSCSTVQCTRSCVYNPL